MRSLDPDRLRFHRFDNSSGMTFADLAKELHCTEVEAETRYEQWMTDEHRRGWYGRPLAAIEDPLREWGEWERELLAPLRRLPRRITHE